jgi:transcriptional regulator of acetoin/glycerol metabolism
MTIARNPKRNTSPVSEEKALAFISGAGQGTGQTAAAPNPERNKKPIMIRVDPDLLGRIDRAAKRLGISRSAFIVSSSAIRLEDME